MNRPHTWRAVAAPLLVAASSLATIAGCRDKPEATASPPSIAPDAGPAAWVATVADAAPAAPPPEISGSKDLTSAFEAAERDAAGHLGVTVIHVESGERASFHGGERFPMQSVFKLAVAIEALARVDAGEDRLDATVHVRPSDVRPGPGGGIAETMRPKGGDPTVLAMITSMLLTSDNTSADLLVARVGGPRKVTERLRALGIDGIDVSRSEAELMCDYAGVPRAPIGDTWTLARFEQHLNGGSRAARTAALAAYLRDPRDTATPDAMAKLLLRVHRQDLLTKPQAATLVSLLEQTKTGKNRVKGLLPAGTVFAHRTGTSDTTDGITAATNDVGILTLPGGAGHVVIAAFLTTARGDEAAREAALAKVGRAVFDHFTKR